MSDSPSSSSDDLPPDLEAWLRDLPEADRSELRATWHLAGAAHPERPSSRKTEASLAQVQRRLRQRRTASEPAPDRAPRPPASETPGPSSGASRRRRLGWATAIAVCLLGAVVWLGRPVTQTAAPGERLATTLPDGSQVALNSGSSITYRRFFWNGRQVTLRGEGFFEVVPEERPFRVHTFNAAVSVMGTAFNVRARPDDRQPQTDVVLTEGAVAVAAASAPERLVRLQPGEQTAVRADAAAPEPPMPTNVDRQLAWRRGGFAFVNTPAGDVFREIERRFDVQIRVPDSLRDRRLTLYRGPAESAMEAAADVCGFLRVACQHTGTTLRISPRGASSGPRK